MKTVYITGIKKYQISIIKGLMKSDLVEGIDYIQGLNNEEYALMWVREDLDIKDFKKAIGTKFIWKHRMRFYSSIEEINPKEDDNFVLTEEDNNFLNKMRREIKLSR